MAPSFKEVLDSGKFVVTAEISPPKGTAVDETLENIDLLKDKLDALNVADNQDAIMRLNPLAVCHMIKEKGGEPVLQLSCRDRNRLAPVIRTTYPCWNKHFLRMTRDRSKMQLSQKTIPSRLHPVKDCMRAHKRQKCTVEKVDPTEGISTHQKPY